MLCSLKVYETLTRPSCAKIEIIIYKIQKENSINSVGGRSIIGRYVYK